MTVDGCKSSAAKFDFQVYYQYLTIVSTALIPQGTLLGCDL